MIGCSHERIYPYLELFGVLLKSLSEVEKRAQRIDDPKHNTGHSWLKVPQCESTAAGLRSTSKKQHFIPHHLAHRPQAPLPARLKGDVKARRTIRQ